jgi:hypothetical protein
MRDLDELFQALTQSKFRARFRLRAEDRQYLVRRSRETIRAQACQLVQQRLAPALPHNDGRQTPMRGHPVFVAQHATATCCRGCLAKWHGIPEGQALSEQEVAYVVSVIEHWMMRQVSDVPLPPDPQRRLPWSDD